MTGTGGSAFLHSWNNSGNVQILDSTFDEAGFLSSFNILNFPGSVAAGSVLISGNTFTRTDNQSVVRPTGNLLGNVTATLAGDTYTATGTRVGSGSAGTAGGAAGADESSTVRRDDRPLRVAGWLVTP